MKWGKRRPGAHLTQTVFLGSNPARAQDPALPRAGCEGTARRHWTRAKGQVVGCPTKVSLTMWSEAHAWSLSCRSLLVIPTQGPEGGSVKAIRGRLRPLEAARAIPSRRLFKGPEPLP